MSKNKIFALENEDNYEDVELETSQEEGEAAAVQQEVEGELVEVDGMADGIEEAGEAEEQLQEVSDLVESSTEDGEGLDPVAAEAVRIAIEAICTRLGTTGKAMGMTSLYATENFASASSRRANTEIAQEGIKEFLKKIWEKIKSAIASLTKKITDFWQKHLSSLGRVRKAVDAMKKTVSGMGKNLKGSAFVEKAPGGLKSAFPADTDISAALVMAYLANHSAGEHYLNQIDNIQDKIAQGKSILTASSGDKRSVTKLLKTLSVEGEIVYGTKDKPLVGGKYNTITIEVDVEDGTIDYTTDSETIDSKEDVGLAIPSKDKLKDVVAVCNGLVKQMEVIQKNADKMIKSVNKVTQEIDRLVADAQGSTNKKISEMGYVARKYMNLFHKAQAQAIKTAPRVFSDNIAAVRAGLAFCGFCVKQYK